MNRCQIFYIHINAAGRWFYPVSTTNKSARHNIAEIFLKVALNTKPPRLYAQKKWQKWEKNYNVWIDKTVILLD